MFAVQSIILRRVFVIICHADGLLRSDCITWDPTPAVFGERTHRANTVAGTQGAHEVAAAHQHGGEDIWRAVELIPDGLADDGHVRTQHHRQQAGDVHRHARHRARALPVVGDWSNGEVNYKGGDSAELAKGESPICVCSLYFFPGLVDLNVLVAMARDVEDVFQSIPDSDETFRKKKESNDKKV